MTEAFDAEKRDCTIRLESVDQICEGVHCGSDLGELWVGTKEEEDLHRRARLWWSPDTGPVVSVWAPVVRLGMHFARFTDSSFLRGQGRQQAHTDIQEVLCTTRAIAVSNDKTSD